MKIISLKQLEAEKTDEGKASNSGSQALSQLSITDRSILRQVAMKGAVKLFVGDGYKQQGIAGLLKAAEELEVWLNRPL